MDLRLCIPMQGMVQEIIMLGEQMKKLISFFVGLLLVLTSVAASHNYERGTGVPSQYAYDFPYGPYGTSIAENEEFSGYYDPVIFGPLGNVYYGGQFMYSYFPFTGNQLVNHYTAGPYYRYEAPYRGSYGYGYGGGYYGAGVSVTGVPGFNAPANRIYGVGY